MSVVAWLYLEFSSALSAELQLRSNGWSCTKQMEHGIFGKDFMHPFLLIGITLDDCVGKRKDKSQNGGLVIPQCLILDVRAK